MLLVGGHGWPRGMWNLSSQLGLKPAAPALEGEVLTTGLPGKSHVLHIRIQIVVHSDSQIFMPELPFYQIVISASFISLFLINILTLWRVFSLLVSYVRFLLNA